MHVENTVNCKNRNIQIFLIYFFVLYGSNLGREPYAVHTCYRSELSKFRTAYGR